MLSIRHLCFVALFSCGFVPSAFGISHDCEHIMAKLMSGPEEQMRLSKDGARSADFAVVQEVDPRDKRALISNEAVAKYIVTLYIGARESYLGTPIANFEHYNLVQYYTDPKIFGAYQHEIVFSNPQSNAARLGNGGSRSIQIFAIKQLNKRVLSDGNETRRYLTRARVDEKSTLTPNAPEHAWDVIVMVELEFANPELSLAGRCRNPLGAQVLNYRVDDDTQEH